MSAENVQSNKVSLSMPQIQSMTIAPSAPPLNVISHETHNYGTALQYRIGHPNETREHRIPRMGHGNMGMYDLHMEMHNYPNHHENQSPHHRHPNVQPSVPACSRDDTAPIPYPPQYPHTLHPNHTLPAPLHHVTTGHYSPGHTAVYPSHLAYTTTPYSPHHQFREQQYPLHAYDNHQELYVHPLPAVLHGDAGTAQLNSPHRRLDFDVVHNTSTHHNVIQKMAAYYTCTTKSPSVVGGGSLPAACRPTGNLPSPWSHSAAYPSAAAVRWPSPSPHHTPNATQRQQFQHYKVHPGQTAAVPQLAPTPAHVYHHNIIPGDPHRRNPQEIPLHQEGEPHHTGQPQPQYHATNGEVRRSHEQQNYIVFKSILVEPQHHISHVHEKETTIASGVESLRLSQEGVSQNQAPLGHGLTLKPASSMTRFRFNKEAILKASNIRRTI